MHEHKQDFTLTSLYYGLRKKLLYKAMLTTNFKSKGNEVWLMQHF